jgi:hypothetical protein
MRFTIPVLTILSTLALVGCDLANDSSDVRERLGDELEQADISLIEAIAIAEGAAPGAVVLEAKLDVHTNVTTYDIELLDGESEREIDVSPSDGAIVRDRSDALDSDDLVEAQSAAEMVGGSVGWAELVAAAEASAGGIAFEVEADGDKGVLEVELLVDGTIWEVDLASDGTVLKSEVSDDQTDDEGLDDDGADDDDGIDDDGGVDEDDDADEDEDTGEVEDEDTGEVEDEDTGEDENETENETEHETEHENETEDGNETED